MAHDCSNWRAGPGKPPYRWEFTENGHDFAVAVNSVILTNDPALNRRLVVAGVGLPLGGDEPVRPYVERRELIPVLEEFSTPFPGFYLYYPQRRQASAPLRALIDYLLERRRAGGLT